MPTATIQLPTKWTDGNGHTHDISSMGTNHIYNCLAKLKTSPQTHLSDNFIAAFEAELASRRALKNRLAVIAQEL